MTTYHDDYRGQETEACVVTFRDNEVIVECKREEKPRKHKGNLVNDRYHLSYWPEVNAFNGTATLSNPDGLMDGKWVETYPDCTCTEKWRAR